MSPERMRYLIAAGIGVPAAILSAAVIVPEARRLALEHDRRQVDIADSPPVDDLQFGYAPHSNNLSRVLELNNQGVDISTVNIFISDLSRQQDEMNQMIQNVCDHNLRPMISWGQSRFLSELSDDDIMLLEDIADQWKSLGCIIDFRMFYEMNGSWVHQVEPQVFVSSWRKIVSIFQEKDATNVKFIFSPNATNQAPSFLPYFPGNDVVDGLALDLYDKSTPYIFDVLNRLAFPGLSAQAVLLPDLNELFSLRVDEEVLIAELGCGVNEQFCIDAIELAGKHGVERVILFGWEKEGVAFGEYNWDLKHRPLLLSYLQEFSRE